MRSAAWSTSLRFLSRFGRCVSYFSCFEQFDGGVSPLSTDKNSSRPIVSFGVTFATFLSNYFSAKNSAFCILTRHPKKFRADRFPDTLVRRIKDACGVASVSHWTLAEFPY